MSQAERAMVEKSLIPGRTGRRSSSLGVSNGNDMQHIELVRFLMSLLHFFGKQKQDYLQILYLWCLGNLFNDLSNFSPVFM